MTRRDACRHLGISKAKLVKLERDGIAQPIVDERRVPDYGTDEIERLRGLVDSTPSPRGKNKPASKRTRAVSATTPRLAPTAITIASDETRTVIDLAERTEAAIRLAEAEGRLAAIRGEEQARQRELDELRARDRSRQTAEAGEARRLAWRRQRVAELLAPHQAELAAVGFDANEIAYATAFAGAVLEAQPDAVLCGIHFPGWLVRDAVSSALRLEPPPPLFLPEVVSGPFGPTQGWRAVMPGE